MSTLRYASRFSGYMPKETGQVVAFVRKKEEFAVNDYIQWVPVKSDLGVYTVIERDAFVRLQAATVAGVTDDRHAWEDGDYRPDVQYNSLKHRVEEYRTNRRNFGWRLGYKTLENTTLYSIKPAHMDMAISQAMTGLTARVWSYLQGTSWTAAGGAEATAASLSGKTGTWAVASDDPANAAYNIILLSLQNAAQTISLATNRKVKPTDLRVVVSPVAAIKIASSAEIRNYVRESPYAREVIEKGMDPQFQLWGLPSTYSGYRFVIEDAPVVIENPKESGVEATTNRANLKDDTTAMVMSRPGGLDGISGAPSFSTIQVYHNGPLTQVEAFDRPRHRLVEGHVVTDHAVVLAAPVAGYRITAITS